MLKLTKEDKQKIKFDPSFLTKKLDLSVGSFYAKYCSKSEMLRELLSKKISDIVGIKCPNYFILKDENCILIENLNNNDNFYCANSLKGEILTIDVLRKDLEFQRDKNKKFINVEEIMIKFNILHFIDILFSNINRNSSNYGFILKKDGTGELVIYNNGQILNYFENSTQPLSFPCVSAIDILITSKEEEAKYFIDNVNDEIIEEIDKIYNIFTPLRLSFLINCIEQETNENFQDKDTILLKYEQNYLMIGKLISFRKNNIMSK